MPEPQNPPPANQDNDDSGDNNPSTQITVAQILDVLKTGTMETTHGLMRYSSNYTFLITMCKDELRLPAIYKPRKGERPLWDFPEGTLYKREWASYLTSEQLGWDIVPPTVVASGEHGIGSLQFYIDHDPEINYFSFDESLAPQLARMSLFDILINNADRKGGHCLIDSEGQLWGIDHGITFNEEHKLRTVIWDFAGQPIPQILLGNIEELCKTFQDTTSKYRQQIDTILNPYELDAFQRRIDQVLTTQRYPTPGPGPNYPWPAV